MNWTLQQYHRRWNVLESVAAAATPPTLSYEKPTESSHTPGELEPNIKFVMLLVDIKWWTTLTSMSYKLFIFRIFHFALVLHTILHYGPGPYVRPWYKRCTAFADSANWIGSHWTMYTPTCQAAFAIVKVLLDARERSSPPPVIEIHRSYTLTFIKKRSGAHNHLLFGNPKLMYSSLTSDFPL